MLGLFGAACSGIALADGHPLGWWLWGLGFTLLAPVASLSRSTGCTLLAVSAFFGFWHTYLVSHNAGFRLARSFAGPSHGKSVLLKVASAPRVFTGSAGVRERFTGRICQVDGVESDFLAAVDLPGTMASMGAVLRAFGYFAAPEAPLNPGQFDEKSFLRRQDIYVRFRVFKAGTVAVLAPPDALIRSLQTLRDWLMQRELAGIAEDPEASQIISGITFGSREHASPDLIENLERSGTLHLFVVDGLKVTFFAGLSWVLLRVCKAGRKAAGIVSLLVLLTYVWLTGFTPSSIRALLMCGLAIAGGLFERPSVALHLLAASGCVMLLINPQELYQAGFQLSFAAVLAMILGVRPLAHWLHAPFARDPFLPVSLLTPWRAVSGRFGFYGLEACAVSLCCWLATLPILVSEFHRVSLSSCLVNLFAVPLAGLILTTAAASVLASVIANWASIYLNNFNWMLAKLFLALVHASTLIPYDAVNVAWPPPTANEQLIALATGRTPVFYLHAGATRWLIGTGNASRWRSAVAPSLRAQGVNWLQGVALLRARDFDEEVWSKCRAEYHCKMFGTLQRPDQADLTFPHLPALDHPVILSTSVQLRLWQEPAAPGSRQRFTGNSAICYLGPFALLLVPFLTNRELSDIRAEPVDILFVSSLQHLDLRLVRQRLSPQLIVSAQAHDWFTPAEEQQPPVLCLNVNGATTVSRIEDLLVVQTHDGRRLTLQKQAR